MGEKEIKAYPCMLEENGNTPYSTDFTDSQISPWLLFIPPSFLIHTLTHLRLLTASSDLTSLHSVVQEKKAGTYGW